MHSIYKREPSAGLSGVECRAVATCVAVGHTYPVYRLSGGSGGYSSTSLPYNAALSDVFCPADSAASCFALGTLTTLRTTSPGGAFRADLGGAEPTTTVIPVRKTAEAASPTGIRPDLQDAECWAATRCVAVGTMTSQDDETGQYFGMLVRSHPSYLGVGVAGPLHAGGTDPQQVALIDDSHALVVGRYFTDSPHGQALPMAGIVAY